ncbi:MAG: DNA recombination/repair protein RecA, partial [Ruminococcus sp.]|nr:DNA recombination/repair protein RecA [Ruminococcus sp.]
VETLKVNGEMVGSHTRAKVVKNKIAPPFREAEFDIMYGEGISREGELLDLAVKAEVVQKAGAWFSYNGQRLGQGRDKVKELLRTDTELAGEIEAKLWENIDKLYDRRRPAPRAKVTEVEAAAPKAAEPKKSSAAKLDALVED